MVTVTTVSPELAPELEQIYLLHELLHFPEPASQELVPLEAQMSCQHFHSTASLAATSVSPALGREPEQICLELECDHPTSWWQPMPDVATAVSPALGPGRERRMMRWSEKWVLVWPAWANRGTPGPADRMTRWRMVWHVEAVWWIQCYMI